MKVLIVSNDKVLASRLQAGLVSNGVDSATHVTRTAALPSVASLATQSEPTLAFLEVNQLCDEDVALLKQLSSCEKLKLVVVGARLSPSTILQAVRNGAMDGVNIDDQLQSELRNLFDRLQG